MEDQGFEVYDRLAESGAEIWAAYQSALPPSEREGLTPITALHVSLSLLIHAAAENARFSEEACAMETWVLKEALETIQQAMRVYTGGDEEGEQVDEDAA